MLDHMSDREFEDVFKKVSEANSFEYNPDSWSKMHAMIQKDKRRRKLLFWFLWGSGIVLGLLALSYFFLYTNMDRNNIDLANSKSVPLSTQIEHQEKSSTTNTAQDAFNNQDELQEGKVLLENPSIVVNESTVDNASFNNQTEINSTTNNSGDKVNQKTVSSAHQESNEALRSNQSAESVLNSAKDNITTQKPNSGQESIIEDHNRAANDKLALIENSSNIIDENEVETSEGIESNNTNSGLEIDQKTTELSTSKTTANAIESNKEVPSLLPLNLHAISPLQIVIPLPSMEITWDSLETIDNKSFKNIWAIDASIGRQWSTSSLSYFRVGDNRMGLSIARSISPKLAISIGAGIHTDRYGVGEDKYSAPAGFWTDGIQPSYTYAMCKILDIPIAVEYHYGGLAQSGFYSTVGLTSVFMLSEFYSYSYEDPRTDLRSRWSKDNANKHLFNDLYLSTGYKFNLSNHWVISLAPYAQIPLRGIGHGKLKLYTIGVKTSVRFMTTP